MKKLLFALFVLSTSGLLLGARQPQKRKSGSGMRTYPVPADLIQEGARGEAWVFFFYEEKVKVVKSVLPFSKGAPPFRAKPSHLSHRLFLREALKYLLKNEGGDYELVRETKTRITMEREKVTETHEVVAYVKDTGKGMSGKLDQEKTLGVLVHLKGKNKRGRN